MCYHKSSISRTICKTWHEPEPWHVRAAVLVPGHQVTSQWLQPLHCVQWATSLHKWKYILLFLYLDPKYRVTSSWQARITQRRAPNLIGWPAPVNGTGLGTLDQVIVIMINVFYTFTMLSKISEFEYLGSTVQSLFTKKNPTFLKELMVFFYMRTINPERVFFSSWTSFKMHQKRRWYLEVEFLCLILKAI